MMRRVNSKPSAASTVLAAFLTHEVRFKSPHHVISFAGQLA